MPPGESGVPNFVRNTYLLPRMHQNYPSWVKDVWRFSAFLQPSLVSFLGALLSSKHSNLIGPVYPIKDKRRNETRTDEEGLGFVDAERTAKEKRRRAGWETLCNV